jgi:hypothetical protein
MNIWPVALRFAVDLLGVDRSSTLDHSFPLQFFSIIISGGPFEWAIARAASSPVDGILAGLAEVSVGISWRGVIGSLMRLPACWWTGALIMHTFERASAGWGSSVGRWSSLGPFLYAPLFTWAATKGGGSHRHLPVFVRFISVALSPGCLSVV